FSSEERCEGGFFFRGVYNEIWTSNKLGQFQKVLRLDLSRRLLRAQRHELVQPREPVVDDFQVRRLGWFKEASNSASR
ncbi:hypothetical protein N8612_04445, partial [Verrucomicrobia bacterium]|nr:hypothetical protein [Verrucomicrobiota bacterium]